MSDWIMLIPSMVFTKIKMDFPKDLMNEYNMTDENFSSVDNQNKEAVFPFVYVHMLPAVETGGDIEGSHINAGMFTFQIEVTDNQYQYRVREVMSAIIKIMKAMRFQVNSMPEFDSGDTHRVVARFRRIIGNGDVL